MRRFFLTFACSVAAVLLAVVGTVAPTRADWSDSFPGGEPEQFWDFTFNAPPFASGTHQFAPDTTGTMGNLTIRGNLVTTIGYGIVPTESFAGRGVVVRSLVNPSGTIPGGPNVGVAGMVDTGPGTGYLATISTTTPGISTLSLVKATGTAYATTTLGTGSFVFSAATPYTVELETLGSVIVARAFNSSGTLLQSLTRLDSTPWLDGFAGVAAWKGSGTAPASPSGNWGTTSARAATPNGGLLWAPTGSISSGTVATGTWTPTSLTWISSTNTSGPVAWDPATPAIFAANGTTGGTVYVSGSAVRVEAGMRFIVGGYRIASATSSPGRLVLGGPDPVFEVDDAPVSSLQVATIDVPLTGTAGFRKAGGGLLALTGTVNTYAGQTRIDDGVLEVSALGNSGSASSIGTGTTFPTIIVGGSATTGTLRYVGSGTAVTNRDVSIGAGGGRIEIDGFGPMLFTAGTFNAPNPSVTTSSTLTIAGGNAGTNTIQGVIQDNSGTASVTLIKDGTGTWILTGANSYSGSTAAGAGTLVLRNSTAMGNTTQPVSVASGATLALDGGIAVGPKPLTVLGGTGTLRSVTGSNSYAGGLSLGGDTVLASGSGAVLALLGTIGRTGTAMPNLVLLGPGTLVLSGTIGNLASRTVGVSGGALARLTDTANTYAGQTRIDDGILEVSALANSGLASSIGTGTTSPTILVGGSAAPGTLRYVGSGTAITNRDVRIGAGGGRIASDGIGPVVFTAGTFNAPNPSVTTSSTLTIAGGNAGTNTILGVIQDNSGTASLTLVKDGTGTWILAGANTYSGGTLVSAGTLLGNDTSLRGAITNNASVIFNQTTSGTYASVMSGSGSLTKTGTGTLELTGANSYSGGTLVSAGTLLGNATSLTGAIANNASVVFNQTTSGTYAGVMSGSGLLTKTGTGTLELTGANSYSDGTLVSAGTLRGNATSLQGVITNYATVVFNQTTTGSYAGIMTGTGSLTKTGTGTLALLNTNYLTGSTTVQRGMLQLANQAALASSKVVPLAGGTVSLTPYLQTTVGGLAPNAGGLVDLGNGLVTVASGLTAADLVTAIVAGRAGGSWTGTSGITSSVAATAVASSVPRAVGWIDNGDGAVTAAFAAPGDTNIDWQVDVLDASNFLSFGKFDSGLPANWLEGDFNYDGVVDVLDAADFFGTGLYDAGNYNTPAGAAGGIAAVPEPSLGATVVVAAVATSWFVRRRRARHIRGAKLFGGVPRA